MPKKSLFYVFLTDSLDGFQIQGLKQFPFITFKAPLYYLLAPHFSDGKSANLILVSL